MFFCVSITDICIITNNQKIMKPKSIFKLALALTIPLFLFSCNNSSQNAKAKKELEANQENIEKITTTKKEAVVVGNAFDSYNGSYDTTNGNFTKMMLIPSKTWRRTSDNVEVLLKPSLNQRYNFSTPQIPILFEVLKHGHANRDPLDSATLNGEASPPGALGTWLPNFNPSSGDIVYVVSMHDEDYGSYSSGQIAQIKNDVQMAVTDCVNNGNCNYSSLIDKFDDVRPRTIGGGTIPPK
jgi:hypothetical protein